MEVEQKHADHAALRLPSLRLLVPPLRLTSAVMWHIVQQRDVLQYGMLADFVSFVTEAVPELFSHTRGVKLILGLRAKLILELCRRDNLMDMHAIQPHLNSIQLALPLVKHVDSTEVEETGIYFVELVQTLIKDTIEREHFFQNVFPLEFGPNYDSAMQTLMWDFLSRLECFLPVPDLLQTVSWLSSESSALKDCEELISNPDNLKLLLHHHKCLGDLDTCGSSLSLNVGDCILSALAGKRDHVDQLSTVDCLLNPSENSIPTRIPVCVMDGTDVETVVVVSEWTEIELGANQDGESLSDVNTNEEGGNALHATDSEQTESNGSSEKNEVTSEGGSNCEKYSAKSALLHKDGASLNDSDGLTISKNLCYRTSEAKQLNLEGQHPVSNATPTMESTLAMLVHSPDDDAVATAPIGTRRSARKPKKTWKIKLVNLQKQERKSATKVVNTQKSKREPVVPKANSNSITSNNRNAAEQSDASSGLVSNEEKTDVSSNAFSCPQCSFSHAQERYLKSHIKKIHSIRMQESETEPHVCPVCGKGYRFPGMLKAHQRTHTGEKPFQCMVSRCGRRFSHIQALRRHRLIHYPKTVHKAPDNIPPDDKSKNEEETENQEGQMYDCLYCRESFSSLSARRDHHKTHPEEEMNRCSDCGKQLSCQAALIRHKRGHMENRPHKCSLCDSSFTCVTSFKRHMLAHQPDRPYHCSCGKGFTYRGALLSHQRTHTAERPYQCLLCDKSFLYPGALRKHEWTHSKEKPYLCSHCGKSFKRERTLRAHMAGHTKDKIFKCSLCDKTFAYKASLTRHELTHKGERPFLCSECGKTFFSFGELLKHQRYHTGHKPFQCEHCDKSFTQACYLQLHTRYHTGVRPYTCPQCAKCFFTSCRLKRHMQIHTGEKPFECTECGKKFRQAYVLKVHQRTHVGERTESIITNSLF